MVVFVCVCTCCMIWCFVALVLKRIRRITEESFACCKAKRAVPSSRAETESCLNKGKFLGCLTTAKLSWFGSKYVSQRMTFLYSPRLGNRSSWPVTKPTASISKAWWPGGTPNLDKTIAPLRMRVDTVLYPHACVVSPPK